MDADEELEEDIDGAIHSIHVKNFFCHDNLEINLNRNVNFVVGRNGSGKSAILTALVVGLGGRASATNRGNNLHSFIKKGANSATIEIKIKNNSEKAYKHNLYGDVITIVRTIAASGSSTYKVKSASGEVISTKFEEVNGIVLAHDIQVDNPISVLNQDDARSFHASDAKKKYSLFRKATNLDQTETNYERALENCDKATSVWKRKYEVCSELEKQSKKWESRYEQLQSRAEIEEYKRKLQDEYYWSEIAEFEKEANSLQELHDKHEGRMNKLMENLSSMEQSFGSDTKGVKALKASLAETNEKKSTLEQELHKLEGELRELQSAWRGSQHSSAKHQEQYNREKRKVSELEKEIMNISSGATTKQRDKLEASAQAAIAAEAAMHARYNTAKNDAQQARLNYQRLTQTSEETTTRLQQQQNNLKQLKMQLRELESRSTDSLAVYGNNMAVLCQRIKEATKRGAFTVAPRGPVGSYLKVKEKKWAGALEHIIGGSMQSFCVNSGEDSRMLFRLMTEVYGTAAKPGVTCSKFLERRHDVRRNKVQASGFLSALDSLDIADPVVANFLIDNVGLESILLVPDHENAIRLSDKVENVPVNCSKVVTLDSTEFHPAPNYRSYGGANRPSRYLQVSTADRKRQLTEEVAEAERAVSALKAAAEEGAREAEVARRVVRAGERAVQALLAEVHEREAAARATTAARDTHQAPHHRVLLEELEVSKQKLSSLSAELAQFADKEGSHHHQLEHYDIQIKAVKTKLSEANAFFRSLNEEIVQEQLKLEQRTTERQMCEQKLSEHREKLSRAAVLLGEKRALVEQKIQQALQLCPRIDNPKEKSVLLAQLKKIQMKLNAIRVEGMTREQVAERLLEIQRKYKTTKHVLDKLNHLIAEVKKTSDKHLNFCHRVQSYIAKRVQYCFQSILTLRGYSGRMDIDNGRGTLEMWCSGREASDARAATSTSSLSGGERSYSTVAFLMALWECVELPFYFMDEFDVFMDNVNRKIVMELLIDHALKNTSRQFVFLTPQDASSVTAGPHLKIHRMADPRQ